MDASIIVRPSPKLNCTQPFGVKANITDPPFDIKLRGETHFAHVVCSFVIGQLSTLRVMSGVSATCGPSIASVQIQPTRRLKLPMSIPAGPGQSRSYRTGSRVRHCQSRSNLQLRPKKALAQWRIKLVLLFSCDFNHCRSGKYPFITLSCRYFSSPSSSTPRSKKQRVK